MISKRKQVRHQGLSQIWDRVSAQVWCQARYQAVFQVRGIVSDQVWDQVSSQVYRQVRYQVPSNSALLAVARRVMP